MPYQILMNKGKMQILDDAVVVGAWGEDQRELGLIQLGALVGNVPDAVALLKKAKTACCSACASGAKSCADDKSMEGKEKTVYDMNDEELADVFDHVKRKVAIAV